MGDKEIKAVSEKLEVTGRFEEKVKKVEEFCNALGEFDASLKTINDWMALATKELEDIKAATEKDLLPQGDKVPSDAQDYKDELNRITKYVMDLQGPGRSATASPRTSSTGPSTGPDSRSLLPGWRSPRAPAPRACPSPATSMRSRPSTRRCPPLTRPASTT